MDLALTTWVDPDPTTTWEDLAPMPQLVDLDLTWVETWEETSTTLLRLCNNTVATQQLNSLVSPDNSKATFSSIPTTTAAIPAISQFSNTQAVTVRVVAMEATPALVVVVTITPTKEVDITRAVKVDTTKVDKAATISHQLVVIQAKVDITKGTTRVVVEEVVVVTRVVAKVDSKVETKVHLIRVAIREVVSSQVTAKAEVTKEATYRVVVAVSRVVVEGTKVVEEVDSTAAELEVEVVPQVVVLVETVVTLEEEGEAVDEVDQEINCDFKNKNTLITHKTLD